MLRALPSLPPRAPALSPILVPVLALALLLPGLPAMAAGGGDPVVAQRGDISLTADGVRDLLAALDTEQQQKLRADPQALDAFVRDRMLQAALLAEARAKQWDQKADIAARIERARQAIIAESYLAALAQPDPAYPSEQDLQTAYEANKSKLLRPRQYRLSQIFVAIPAGAPSASDDAARARLAGLRQQWLKGDAAAATILKKAAGDAHPAAAAADLGWVSEDQVVPALRPTVAGMSEGGVCEPVRMADGWHIVRLNETRPAAPASLAEVHDGLVRALRQARQQQNARAYLDGLLQRTPIQLNEIELAHVAAK